MIEPVESRVSKIRELEIEELERQLEEAISDKWHDRLALGIIIILLLIFY